MGTKHENFMIKTTYYSNLSTLMDWNKRDGKKKIYKS